MCDCGIKNKSLNKSLNKSDGLETIEKHFHLKDFDTMSNPGWN